MKETQRLSIRYVFEKEMLRLGRMLGQAGDA
jgi:hypothetical protein